MLSFFGPEAEQRKYWKFNQFICKIDELENRKQFYFFVYNDLINDV